MPGITLNKKASRTLPDAKDNYMQIGTVSYSYNAFSSQNGYKITKLYYITQVPFLPVKKHPSPKLVCKITIHVLQLNI